MKSPTTTETGRRGEALAKAWAERQGWLVQHQNLRIGPLEIDLACQDATGWLLIEVKTLTAADETAHPEWQLTQTKHQHLLRALEAFDCAFNPACLPIRFDLVAVLLLPAGRVVIRHYPDAVRA